MNNPSHFAAFITLRRGGFIIHNGPVRQVIRKFLLSPGRGEIFVVPGGAGIDHDARNPGFAEFF